MERMKKTLCVLIALAMVCTCFLGAISPAYALGTERVAYQAITSLDELSTDAQYVLVFWRYFGGTDADSTKGYVFHGVNNGDLRVDTADHYATITYGANDLLADEALWNIIATEDGYTLRNVGTGKYLDDSIPADADAATTLTIVQGISNGYTNFCIGTSSTCIRFSGTSNKFSFMGSTPTSQVTGTNACNITIYKVVAGGDQPPVEPTEPVDPTNPTDPPVIPSREGHQIFFASDYQGSPAASNLETITGIMKNAGVEPELAVWCGDYVDGSVYEDGSDTSQADMLRKFGAIQSTMTGYWPNLKYRAIQGNHDYSGWVTNGTLDATGAYEYEDYNLYLINEDDFPWWQAGYNSFSDQEVCKAAVEKTAADLDVYLKGLIEADSTKPVIIATHVPLHWSMRTTTSVAWWSDNIFAAKLFHVVNEAAKDLDIVFLFGHNHSENFGNYPEGGTVNLFQVGDTIRIPDGTVASNNNYTNEVLNFTYFNAGYIGKTNASFNPSISTASILTITDGQIFIDRYSTDGLYEAGSTVITRHNFDEATLSVASTGDLMGIRKEGKTETFVATTRNITDVTYHWTTDHADVVNFPNGTSDSTASVLYTGGGEALVTCVITGTDVTGTTVTLTDSYAVSIQGTSHTGGTSYVAVTDVKELSADETYVLAAWRYFGGSNSDSTNAYLLWGENNGSLRARTEDAYETLTIQGELPAAAQWKITPTSDGYTFQNVGDSQYLGANLHGSKTAEIYTITSGECGGYHNYAIAYQNRSIRFSGTSNSFSLSNVSPTSAVTTTNACNFTIYQVVTEKPEENLKIVSQPESFVGALNAYATFHVETNRSDVTYKWYFSNTNGRLWCESTLTGHDTATMTIKMAQFRLGQMYKCVVTDSTGDFAQTEIVSMNQTPMEVEIVKQPVSSTDGLGKVATFTVEAQGEGLTYQWYWRNPNSSHLFIKSGMPGAKTPTLQVGVIAFRVGQMYKCVVTDAAGHTVESEIVYILGA